MGLSVPTAFVVCIPLDSLLTTSVTKLSEFFTRGLWDRIHRETRVSTHPSECLVAPVSPVHAVVSLRCWAIAPTPSLPSSPSHNHAIVLNLSLAAKNISGRLTLAENLKLLHLCLGGDRTPTINLKLRFGKPELVAIAPRHLLGL
jgi:hypothetical protein